jgi:thiol-disulfide isomerase/thioredoxin
MERTTRHLLAALCGVLTISAGSPIPLSRAQPPAQPSNAPAAAPATVTLEQRVAALEQQVAELKRQLERAAGPTPEQDAAAQALRSEGDAHYAAGRYTEAKAKYDELATRYPTTRVASSAQSLRAELAVVGRAAPAALEVEKWYQGEPEGLKALQSKATLLVFFEEWCPHCQREVPKLAAAYQKYKGQGLAIVGLTRLSRGVTEEKLQGFLQAQSVPYPVAKETGTQSQYFNVSGIPAAALLKNGKVIWRGNPGRLTDAMIDGWLEIPTS